MADLFSRWKIGLARSSKAAFGRLAGIFGATEITTDTWDQLEAMLIQADLGLETTEAVIDSLKSTVRTQGLRQSSELRSSLELELRSNQHPLRVWKHSQMHCANLILPSWCGAVPARTSMPHADSWPYLNQ